MAENLTIQSGQPKQLTPTETAIETRELANTSTSSTSQKRGRGRPRGTGKTTTEKGVSGLVVLEPKAIEIQIPGEEAPADPPKKKAGRPKGTASKVAAPKKIDTIHIKVAITTASAILASRPGMGVWLLSEKEVDMLSEPIANIMAKNAALAGAMSGEHADAIALVIVCFTIFTPKLLTYLATKPKKVKQGEVMKYGSTKPATTGGNEKREAATAVRNDDRKLADDNQAHGQTFGGQLYQLIPPTAGF